MNTDRSIVDNVSLASEEQLDEVRAVFDKALTILFKDMNSERAQSFITNKDALSSVLKSIDFPLVVNKRIFQIRHNSSLRIAFGEDLAKAVELDKDLPVELCPDHRNTTVAVIKVFQNGILTDINNKIGFIGFNTGCLRTMLFAGLYLVNIGYWLKCDKLVSPFQVVGEDFQYFIFENIEGSFSRFRLSMKSIPVKQYFETEKVLFVGFKNLN